MKKYSYPKNKIKILLLENIHPLAVQELNKYGYTEVEVLSGALSEEQLILKLKDVHILGIRSKTEVTRKVLESAKQLLAVGCFCIGTNQVDLRAACQNGITVFNAPFSNTRSVAELTMASIVMLARGVFQRSMELHKGTWKKIATGSHEVRHKTLGIIGYGHIGPQVGLLAEAFGMKVIYLDVKPCLALGNAKQVESIDELVSQSDFVSVHVPETPQTKNMFAKREFDKFKKGAMFLNLSRGTVVEIEALAEALKNKQIGGAAVDVYPEEPHANTDDFRSCLQGLDNVILTPHIGGSTEEAQASIGREVVQAMIAYIDTGSTPASVVNFPLVDPPILENAHRVLNIHKNVPGILSRINTIIAGLGANIEAQYLGTNQDIGYLIIDVDQSISSDVKSAIDALEESIKTRLLF
jgi:D-3-phosphoglycerate dehydrogenase / 2-oxoglutarate reductase